MRELVTDREFLLYCSAGYREFSVTVAARLATICDESSARKLKSKLSDSSNFGLAKSFFSAGRTAGFDMRSKEDVAAFTMQYNQQLVQPRATIDEAPTLVREKPAVGRNESCPLRKREEVQEMLPEGLTSDRPHRCPARTYSNHL